MRIIVTGGAGFVGGNLCRYLKEAVSGCEIIALDNLSRVGSELNLPALKEHGIRFIRGDVRSMDDLKGLAPFEFLVECSAEPSVQAGANSSPEYVVQSNLHGATNCVEVCRQENAGLIFISSSRIYPIKQLNDIKYVETEKRFVLSANQTVEGVSDRGINENFPLTGLKSLYGATKYAAELILDEYRYLYDIPIVIIRCGLIAGPWQFGRIDQGIVAYWLAAHMFDIPLRYIGFNGSGKQVRDVIHIHDLARLVVLQISKPETFINGPFNVGGGVERSVSLLELSSLCREITGKHIRIGSEPKTRYADIPIYISDNAHITSTCGWKPTKTVSDVVEDYYKWIRHTEGFQNLFISSHNRQV